MVLTQTDETFDFTNATDQEKKDLIIKLFNKQKELALFLLFPYFPVDSDLRLAVSFTYHLLSISCSNFGDFFYQQITNGVMNSDDFSSLFAQKLDDHIALISNQSAQN